MPTPLPPSETVTLFPNESTFGRSRVIIVGGGPAGLAAAEALVDGGVEVDLYDAMPSVGRKFLLAGLGGLNLTHSEPHTAFVGRFGSRSREFGALLKEYSANELRTWARGLGIETFVGSSGRVFPMEMKAAPLLRAWLSRLRARGVRFHTRQRWVGWGEEEGLVFDGPQGSTLVHADAVVFALGGASWPKLGSDAAWVDLFGEKEIEIAPLKAANCGFDVQWSEFFSNRFAGAPVKTVAISLGTGSARRFAPGEFAISPYGIEGSLVYSLSRDLRDQIDLEGSAEIFIDLLPAWSQERVDAELFSGKGNRSMSSHLQSRAKIGGVKAALLREVLGAEGYSEPRRVAASIKALPLTVVAARPLAEAISTAGGIKFESLDANLMARSHPGIFFAGEMLDWEAPTGGYLLSACFATGRAAGTGALRWLTSDSSELER